jgi:hypothetical protein
MKDKDAIEAMISVLDACEAAAPSLDEQLVVLSLAWIERAQRIRSEALAIPGAFPQAKERQLADLERIAETVRADVPDLELERLHHEGDLDGVRRHLGMRGSDSEPHD